MGLRKIHPRGLVILSMLMLCTNAFAQKERKHIREGNRSFEKDRYQNAEVAYRKAINTPELQFDAGFNVGDALYKQEKYPEALEQFSSLEDLAKTPEQKAALYHNLGNTLMKQQKYKESIEAYKNALRQVPEDMETKYNLAYAQQKLKDQQQQEQQKDNNKDQNKDQKPQNNKDQNNKDKKDKNKDQQNKQDKNKQQQPNDQEKDKKQSQQQPQQQQLSKADAERLLKALANDEEKTQKKVKKKQAKAKRKKTEKEW